MASYAQVRRAKSHSGPRGDPHRGRRESLVQMCLQHREARQRLKQKARQRLLQSGYNKRKAHQAPPRGSSLRARGCIERELPKTTWPCAPKLSHALAVDAPEAAADAPKNGTQCAGRGQRLADGFKKHVKIASNLSSNTLRITLSAL